LIYSLPHLEGNAGCQIVAADNLLVFELTQFRCSCAV